MAFINRNVCKSFSAALNSSTWTKLSAQECSEVVVLLYDGNASTISYAEILDPNSSTPFRVFANRESTIRGLTNSGLLSAKASGNFTLYYRTQYYGSMLE
jgi:transposase-like protein